MAEEKDQVADIMEAKRSVAALRDRAGSLMAELEKRVGAYVGDGQKTVERIRNTVDVSGQARKHPGWVIAALLGMAGSLVYSLWSRRRWSKRFSEATHRLRAPAEQALLADLRRAPQRSVTGTLFRTGVLGGVVLVAGLMMLGATERK